MCTRRLFNDAVSNSKYMALNGRVMRGKQNGYLSTSYFIGYYTSIRLALGKNTKETSITIGGILVGS
jgi:hypothetical protein